MYFFKCTFFVVKLKNFIKVRGKLASTSRENLTKFRNKNKKGFYVKVLSIS